LTRGGRAKAGRGGGGIDGGKHEEKGKKRKEVRENE